MKRNFRGSSGVMNPSLLCSLYTVLLTPAETLLGGRLHELSFSEHKLCALYCVAWMVHLFFLLRASSECLCMVVGMPAPMQWYTHGQYLLKIHKLVKEMPEEMKKSSLERASTQWFSLVDCGLGPRVYRKTEDERLHSAGIHLVLLRPPCVLSFSKQLVLFQG